MICGAVCLLLFFKQKAAYEMRISGWSSDVCSSDLGSHEFVSNIIPLGEAPPLSDQASIDTKPPQEPEKPAISEQEIRSEESRAGKECVSTCRSRWSPIH